MQISADPKVADSAAPLGLTGLAQVIMYLDILCEKHPVLESDLQYPDGLDNIYPRPMR